MTGLSPQDSAGRQARRKAAATATVAVGRASKLLRLGSGSVIGGRVGLVIDPNLVGGLASGRRCALVSGTNGKTTTTRLLVSALEASGSVATSGAGANLPSGVVAALASMPKSAAAVLEVDEGFLGTVARATSAEVLVLLNLSRDQLDRMNEVRMLAQRWRDAIESMPDVTVVANADDPLVAWAAGADDMRISRGRVRFVAAGELWHEDATGCPVCGGRITFPEEASWYCECGFTRPETFAALTPFGLAFRDGRTFPISLSLPARCNRSNAAMAAVAADALGTDPEPALKAMASVTDVEGRFSSVTHEGVTARLLLAKNPAGWAELLDFLVGRGAEPENSPTGAPVVVAVNARIADGHDPSWLWDVPFEQFAGRLVVATGDRCRDLAVRLKYAGVEHMVVPDQVEALSAPKTATVDYVGNYTAFQLLRRGLSSPQRLPAPPDSTEFGTRYAALRRPSTSSTESALRIAVVHPDLLGTYGDGGNGRILASRAAWRGMPVELIFALSNKALPLADIYCLGGGEDGPQVEAASLLSTSVIRRAVDEGATVLAVCAGFQIVGNSFPDATGRICEGLGLLDVVTTKGTGSRAVGEITADPLEGTLGDVSLERLTGFENHAGVTKIGSGASPLGRVVLGLGNGFGLSGLPGEVPRAEGAVSGRVVGTYLHGPVLARNPFFADAILSLATGLALEPLDDTEEAALHLERLSAAGSPMPAESTGGLSGALARRRNVSKRLRARKT